MGDLDLRALGGFIGTEQYHNVLGARVTDGVAYIMENGYAWFVTDALAVILSRADLRGEPFLVVKLTRHDGKAEMTIDDGGKDDNEARTLYFQWYEWTDARRDLKLYWEDGVLLLPSEH